MAEKYGKVKMPDGQLRIFNYESLITNYVFKSGSPKDRSREKKSRKDRKSESPKVRKSESPKDRSRESGD